MITVRPKHPVKKIGVVSDTHIPTRGKFLPPALFRLLAGVDLILHAGDLVSAAVLEELAALAPVEAVAGNMDPPELHKRLGRQKLIRLPAVSIGLIHGDGARSFTAYRAAAAFAAIKPDLVVFGHSHMPFHERRDGVALFNPGSPVVPRRAPGPSCGLLRVEGNSINGEILFF